MKNQTIKSSVFIILLLIITGCQTFFEEDISNQKVVLLSPVPGIETEIVSQTFWWTEIEGATDYRLQIVTPSFDSSEVLILDTLISKDKFSKVLFPSDFEWRVRAENNVFKTDWSKGFLYILSTDDLTRQTVNLISPSSITNLKKIKFEWDYLYNADNYLFVAYKEEWDGILEITPTITDTTFLEKVLPEGKFSWGVKARNSVSETLYSQKSLIVDSTPPDIPILLSPTDEYITTNTSITFSWSSSDLTSGILYDSLKVYSDKDLSLLVKSAVSNQNATELTFSDRITYYWNICSVDRAGNTGLVSDTYSFTIN
jgi:hypothetical protein